MREVDGKKEYLDEETNEWVSKTELKKRQTLRKKAKEQAEKAAKKKRQSLEKRKKKNKMKMKMNLTLQNIQKSVKSFQKACVLRVKIPILTNFSVI